MPKHIIGREEVIERIQRLPSSPVILGKVLETIDDPDSNLNILDHYIRHDPVLSARVLSLANVAASRYGSRSIANLHTAISFIGINSIREIVLCSSIFNMIGKSHPDSAAATFVKHSISVGICSAEVARDYIKPDLVTAALISGLMHDIGQLWLYMYDEKSFNEVWNLVLDKGIDIEEAEYEKYGVNHSIIGSWLAECWSLPESICASVLHHHTPDSALNYQLVPVVHVAEILSNALDLTGRRENRVKHLSSQACKALGLIWNSDIQTLFCRVDGRSRYATSLFH